jgi:hypothetical protein
MPRNLWAPVAAAVSVVGVGVGVPVGVSVGGVGVGLGVAAGVGVGGAVIVTLVAAFYEPDGAGGLIIRAVRSLAGRQGHLAAGHPAQPAGLPGGPTGRAMRLAARLMPPATGRRWLAEADSFLFEAPPERRAAAVRDYLATAPRVITAGWAGELARRTVRRRAAGGGHSGGHHGRG